MGSISDTAPKWHTPVTYALLWATLLISVVLTGVALLGLNPHLLGFLEVGVMPCTSHSCSIPLPLGLLQDYQSFGIRLDFTILLSPLASLFLLLIGGLSVAITIFSFQFLRSEPDRLFIAIIYPLFLFMGTLFVVADNAFWAILALEGTTLTFGLLVMHQRNRAIAQGQAPDDRYLRAIRTYLIANHIGGAFVAGALLLLAARAGGSVTLDMSAFHSPGEPAASIVFLLALVGFGIKAGMAPFHVWVAVAHPSSPTNTHSMSLGILIKIAIFGMIRVFFQFLMPDIPWWWGALLVALAALTTLLGVRNALYGEDLKDSLADHSVENIGIILTGAGLALLFASHDTLAGFSFPPALAALALAAGLYHLLNHTVFKGLLYICTGAALQLNEKDNTTFQLHQLGGILRASPILGTCFVVGSIALAGFPPFNGFISEWLTLQATLGGIHIAATDPGHTIAAVLSAVLLVGVLLFLGAAFALTALAFVKIAGEAFLGETRNKIVAGRLKAPAPDARVTRPQELVMIALSVTCLILGIFAWPVLGWLGGIVRGTVPGLALGSVRADGSLGIAIDVRHAHVGDYAATLSQWVPLAMLAVLAVAALVGVISRSASADRAPIEQLEALKEQAKKRELAPDEKKLVRSLERRKDRVAPWTTATEYQPEIMQYQSIAFNAPWSEFAENNSIVGRRKPAKSGQKASQGDTDPFATPFTDRFLINKKTKKPIPAEAPSTFAPLAGDPQARSLFRSAYVVAVDVLRVLVWKMGAFIHNGRLRYYLIYILVFFVIILITWFLWLAVIVGGL